MNPYSNTTPRRSRLRESFTPSASVHTNIASTPVDSSDCATSGSEATYAIPPNKRKGPFRAGFSSLRKSAKNLFKIGNPPPSETLSPARGKYHFQPQEFEDEQRPSVLNQLWQAKESFHVPAAEVAPRIENEPLSSMGTAPFCSVSQVDLSSTLLQSNPATPSRKPSSVKSSSQVDSSDTLSVTNVMHEALSSTVFTPPPSTRASSRLPSPPPTPPPKTEHAPFDLEAALKDIASQAVALPAPAYHSPYLNGAVVYLKCIVFTLASVGICAMALPSACLALIGISNSVSKREELGDRVTVESRHCAPEVEDTHVVEPDSRNTFKY